MYLRIIILIFALLYSSAGWGKVIIRGKIIGYDGKTLVYYQPTIEGIFAPYGKEVKPASNGTFKIEFENEGYGNIKVGYKAVSYRFFYDTNSQIYFEIKELPERKSRRIPANRIFILMDSLKQLMTIKIGGDYEAINRFYNKNLRSSYFTNTMVDGSHYSELIYNSTTPSSALALLDSLKQIEIDQINQLPRTVELENPLAEKKDKEIKDFLINEVNAFYGGVFLNGMFLKRTDQYRKMMKDSTVNPDIYNRDWELLIEKLYEQAKSDLKATPNSPDYLDFMETMASTLVNYKQYEPPEQTMNLDESVRNRLFNYDTALFFDKKTRYAYELKGLQLFLNSDTFFSPTLLNSVYELQAKYPTSAHFEFYKQKIEKLKTNLEVSKQDFNEGRIIQANYDSFEKLLKRFEGKNVFIDIWATWCHPCIEEFQYKSVTQPFIESGKIELLYISVDKSEWEDRWMQSIKINELQGSHFRADKKFIEDMWNVIGGEQGVIPRYVLINKEGKIFKRTAARPSSEIVLVKQIELLH